MKNLCIMNYDSLAVSTISIIYGFVLIIFPDLIDYGQTYETLSDILNSFTFGSIFIILGFLMTIGILMNLPKLRAFSISCLITIWTLFLISLLFSGVVNSVWVFSLAMVVFSFGIVFKGWFR